MIIPPGRTATHTVGVFGALFDEHGRVLLVHQNYGTLNWALPGGALETDEDPLDGVVREVDEETGIRVRVEHLIGLYAMPYRDDLILLYRVSEIGRRPWEPDDEISEIGFFRPDALPAPLPPSAHLCIEDAVAGRRGIHRSFPLRMSLDGMRVFGG